MITKELKADSARKLFSARAMCSIVEGETLVSALVFSYDEGFIELWRDGATLAELIDFVNENY